MYNDIYPPLWYNTQQFRCPKNLLYSIPPIYPSLPIATALATTNLFTVFIVLLFLECYIVGLIQYITSSACSFNLLVCISFHGQMAHFFFFFLIIFFINALIFCSSGSLLLCRLFSSCRGQGYSSCRRLLTAVASLVAEQGCRARGLQQLRHTGSVGTAAGRQSIGSTVVAHGLSSAACGVFSNW